MTAPTISTQVHHTGNGKASITLCDLTQNKCSTFGVNWSSSYAVINQQVEWIVERTEEDGIYPNLADFGETQFSGSIAYNSNGTATTPLGSLSRQQLDMTANCSGSSPVIATVGSLYGNGENFGDTWNGYGDGGIKPC